MTLLLSLFTACLFVLLVPGILVRIPRKGPLLTAAIVHGLLFTVIFYIINKCLFHIYINEGFDTSYVGTITEPTAITSDMIIKDSAPTQRIPKGSSLPAGATLYTGTQLVSGFKLPFDIIATKLPLPADTTTLPSGVVYKKGDILKETITLAADINIPEDIPETMADIVFAYKPTSRGPAPQQVFPPYFGLGKDTVFPTGTILGVGTKLPVDIPLAGGTNHPRDVALTRMIILNAPLTIPSEVSEVGGTIVMPPGVNFMNSFKVASNMPVFDGMIYKSESDRDPNILPALT